MIENKEIAAHPDVPAFLRAASALGYSLGRTPLNAFLNNSGKNLPALDDAATQSLKTLHRLFQVTPSTESLQAAMTLGFTSANHIASYSKDEFMNNYAYAVPSGRGPVCLWASPNRQLGDLQLSFRWPSSWILRLRSTALSSSGDDRQNAKNTIVQQFPSMASLFGNLDFCQCEDCRSVLSPAAYFVDVLDLLGKHSAVNSAGYTPLDVLIGSVSKMSRCPAAGRTWARSRSLARTPIRRCRISIWSTRSSNTTSPHSGLDSECRLRHRFRYHGRPDRRAAAHSA